MTANINHPKRWQTTVFYVTFYWLIGKLSLSSFIPAPNFKKIRTIRWVKSYLNLTRSYYDEIQDADKWMEVDEATEERSSSTITTSLFFLKFIEAYTR